jgi:ADP-ribose pyrophosphatase YjhB (NUDIX family)
MFVAQELYSQILRVMPIPCVDLLVVDEDEKVLLLLRKNEPAAGQWWFPGGRVLFGERREEAAKRKLEEECGITATRFQEIGTFDLLFQINPDVCIHSITTLFKVRVVRGSKIRLDHQSDDARWLCSADWAKYELDSFVGMNLACH